MREESTFDGIISSDIASRTPSFSMIVEKQSCNQANNSFTAVFETGTGGARLYRRSDDDARMV